MILALDTATVTGWAAGRVGSAPAWGSQDFSDKAGSGAVLGKFRYWLNQRCHEFSPKLIVFEAPYVPINRQPKFVRAGEGFAAGRGGPPPMNPLTLRRLLGLTGIVEATAYELGIECREATAGEITKFFTGRMRHGGRDAKKAATITMCRAYGWDVADNDDAADALALWCMAEAQLDPRAAMRRGDGPLFLKRQSESASRPGRREALETQTDDRSSSSHGRQELFTQN